MFTKRLLCLVVLLAALQSARAEVGCGLDARNRKNVPLPVLSSDAMSPELAAELQRGFEAVMVELRSAEGERMLQVVEGHAAAAHNVCAQGLAIFGQGAAARVIRLADALPLYQRAETLLGGGVASPLTMAYLHQRTVSVQHFLGHNDVFLRDDPAVRNELRQAGDVATATTEQSLAYQWGAEVEQPEKQEQLLGELKAVDAANVVGAKAFLQWEWGSILRRRGRFAESLGPLHAAQALLKECDCMPSTVASVHLDLSFEAEESGDGDTAVREAQEADRIYREYHLETLRPQALRVLAAAYHRKGDLQRTLATYEESLLLARKLHVTSNINLIGSLLASAYGEAGEPLKGIEVLKATRSEHPLPSERCVAQGHLQGLEAKAGLYADAVVTAADVLATCEQIFSPLDYANVEWNLSDEELHLNQLDDSLRHARDAVRIIEEQRKFSEQDDTKLNELADRGASGYVALVNVLAKMNRADEALLASEQFRARAFIDLARSREVQQQRPAIQGTAVKLRSTPRPFVLTVQDLRDIIAKQHSTLLSYWVTGDGQLYTWLMRPDAPVVQITQAVTPERLQAMVDASLPKAEAAGRGTRGGVRTRGGSQLVVASANRRPWRDLYSLLIAPIEDQLPKEPGALLTVVPQSALFRVSFPALINARGHYLLEQYAVHTVPSAGVLQVTTDNETEAAKGSDGYLLVANPRQFPKVNGLVLPPLPGTAAEARGITRALHGEHVTLLEGREAGIERMEDALPKASVLHLATHAVVSDETPMSSFLALDRSQRGGVLNTAAVYGLQLHTRLVVLSACGTGRGKISGDGVAGLSRAFFYAGAASLVTTLWDVVDEPTAQLMPKFYEGLAKGESRSAALRDAQLGLIRDLRAGRVRVQTLAGTRVSLPESPAYWAAFSLSGQP